MIRFLVTSLALCFGISFSSAMEVQKVTSPGGITAWLVESHTIPLLAMNFSFEGGTTLDPDGKDGTVHFITGMMDEGADDLDSPGFQAARDALAVKLSFDDSADRFAGSFQTLSVNRDAAFELLRKAVTKPHFEATAMERVRQQFLVAATEDASDPNKMAANSWMKMAFGNQPYARNGNGSVASIAKVTPDDLRAMHKLIFTRKGLKVAVVGDIDAKTLAGKLDEVFGALPDTPAPDVTQNATVAAGPKLEIINHDIPQSIIIFGGKGLLREDPDFIPAFVMSHILGGGAFSSRLSNEVREKRGLTYGISFSLEPLKDAGLVLGTLSTRNEKAGEAMQVIGEVMREMANTGPTQKELDDAKTYLTGSYALRFDSNTKIAAQLLGLMQQGFEPDYIKNRNAMIEAVTLEQVKAQAKRLIDPDRLLVSVVGHPEGLKP